MEETENKKLKKILFLSGKWSDLGGLNKMISTVASALTDNYDVTVCSMDICKPDEGYKLDKKVKFIQYHQSELYNLEKILLDLDIDIFVGSNNCDKQYLDLYRKLSDTRIKTIMWNHEFYFLPFLDRSLWGVALFRTEIFQYPDAIIWLTETSTKICQQYSNRVWTIGNSIGESKVKYTASKHKKSLNIVSIGRFDSKQKGVGYLIYMFNELLKLNPDSYLYVVGRYDLSLEYSDSTSETVQQLLDRLEIPVDRFKFVGEVQDVFQFLSESFINVMTSEMEGFGLTILEAAKMNVPSIIFSGGGSADIISNGKNGFVVKYGDYVAMANSINDLFKNKSLYEAMQDQLPRLIDAYSLEIIKSKWLKLLLSLERGGKSDQEPKLLSETEKLMSLYEYSLLKTIREQEVFDSSEIKKDDSVLKKMQNSYKKNGFWGTGKKALFYIMNNIRRKTS